MVLRFKEHDLEPVIEFSQVQMIGGLKYSNICMHKTYTTNILQRRLGWTIFKPSLLGTNPVVIRTFIKKGYILNFGI